MHFERFLGAEQSSLHDPIEKSPKLSQIVLNGRPYNTKYHCHASAGTFKINHKKLDVGKEFETPWCATLDIIVSILHI